MDDDAGKRLDQYLTVQFPSFSRTQLQQQITNSDVLVNSKPTKSSYRIHTADTIEIELPPPLVIELIPEPIPLDIIYENDDLLVLNKQAGLVVHPAAGIVTGTLANGLAAYLEPSNCSGSPMRPGIVHRLDRDTSGLMVVAKNQFAYKHLTEQFAERKVKKQYLALVYGQMKTPSGVIDLPIGRHTNQRTKMAVMTRSGRPAWTSYKASKQWSNFSLLEVEIKTGRTHQIRVHLAHINHPVVGDEVYGAGRIKMLYKKKLETSIKDLNRHFLHAAKLAFIHPRTDEWLDFSSPLPPELDQFLANIEVDS
ncbi:MAG: rluA [bacterium]|nr:MAG: rluA [bacterium]